ncbi:MAG: zinc-ribbon domain-containing protein [Bacilli bacterium]|nr:zinc-ribbon domain-containing protein [Bacilli bacterium]MBN2876499.1 zinc-ribbon domain-containing protein [Bacilli bacterium]
MAYCTNCGHEISDEAVVCPNCGVPQKKVKATASNDTGSIGWGILGFCIPLVGLILYLVWKDTQPNNAKTAGTGALIGFILNIIGSIIIAANGVPGL